jgi:hypothetical protein
MEGTMTGTKLAAAMASSLLMLLPARGEEMLRIAMTASDIPTATGIPNSGFEGYRFMNKKVHGFVSAQSWFTDLTLVSMH